MKGERIWYNSGEIRVLDERGRSRWAFVNEITFMESQLIASPVERPIACHSNKRLSHLY